MKLIIALLTVAILSIPVKAFGQTPITEPVQKSIPIPITTSKPVSTTIPQSTPITKPADSNLVDESYCHQFDFKSCPPPKCEVYPSCPFCQGGFSCHATGFHKPAGTKYEPPLYPETKTRKIEVKPVDGTEKIEITDDKGVVNTIEPEELTEVIISPDPEKCKPKPCTVLTLKVEEGKMVINSKGVIAKTSLPVKIEEDRITVETEERNVEVLKPSNVKEKLEAYTKAQPNTLTITSLNLDNCKLGNDTSLCNGVPNVYKVEAIRKNKFLGFLPIESNASYTLNAVTGETIQEDSPWYLKTLPFLFR